MTFTEFPVYLSGKATLMEKHQTMGMNIRTPRKAAHRHTAHQSEAESTAERTQSSATVIDINEYARVSDSAIAKHPQSTWL